MNNSLAEVHPELVSEWSEKNLPLTPDDITFGSNKKVWWKGACGHEWQTSVKARSSGEKCPICSGTRVIAGINDLATLEPLLAKQWSKKNKIKPTEVSIGSHKKVIWKCEKGHEWEAVVKSRTINKTGCPYCSHNKVLAGFNDLATLLPDIAAEWSDRNYPLLPTQVTVFANRKAWWKCKDCGREWNTLITWDYLKENGMLDDEMMEYLADRIGSGYGFLISGRGGSGKSTLLNNMVDWIPFNQSILVSQESDELYSNVHPQIQFEHSHTWNTLILHPVLHPKHLPK